jgi:2-polyprenyl-6-methoxyphenol hydroxylase-like FAD-dependent oxidoreductase
MKVAIVGAGIGGLTLALELHDAGIDCEIYEAVAEIRPVGVGINVLPHAARILTRLGVDEALAQVSVETRESAFFNRFGQLIYREPAGRFAGYRFPQFSVHRGELQRVLLATVGSRLGDERVILDHTCTGAVNAEEGIILSFRATSSGEPLAPASADIAVACDGIHSLLRKQLHPLEGPPLYSGVNMWRGTAVHPPFLTGATMVRAGWLATGKMVIYPIRDNVDAAGNQLVNWVAEIQTPRHADRDWNREGRLDDFIGAFADWHFDWLDVPALIRGSTEILEYPMVDQDPLDRWTEGRLTLLGDAAHPMVPRGSNGAGQAILDAEALCNSLVAVPDPADALRAYEAERLPTTAAIVRTNRATPPDAILREVWERTGDRPFDRIEDVIAISELRGISDRYKTIAGFSHEALAETRAGADPAHLSQAGEER